MIMYIRGNSYNMRLAVTCYTKLYLEMKVLCNTYSVPTPNWITETYI